jgi:hypothetical protein
MAVGVTTPEEVEKQVQRALGVGLEGACIFLSNRIKETLSVPAPRATVTDPFTGQRLTIASEPATPGAPPRKVTGELRGSHTWEMNADKTVGRVGTNKAGARQLEEGGFIRPVNKQSLRWVVADLLIGPTRGNKQQFVGRSVFSKGVYQAPHPSIMPTFLAQRENLGRIIGPLAAA